MEIRLMDKTRELLKECKKPMPEIAYETGISFYWLRKFKSGEIADPGVNRIQELYEYLNGAPLLK